MWFATEGGALKSVSYQTWWEPGVNTFECKANRKPVDASACSRMYHNGTKPYAHTEQCPMQPACPYPTIECSCGFYAYHDGSHWTGPSKSVHQVFGVIEAWGRLVIGTKGFRAEKALIVALKLPEDPLMARLVEERYPAAAHFYDETLMLERVPLTGPS